MSVAFSALHAGRAIEDEDDGVDRATAPAEEAAGEWAGDGKGEGGDGEGAAGENEDVFEPFLSARFLRRFQEELHGGPLHRAEPSSVQEVNDDRDGCASKTPEKDWMKEGHLEKRNAEI